MWLPLLVWVLPWNITNAMVQVQVVKVLQLQEMQIFNLIQGHCLHWPRHSLWQVPRTVEVPAWRYIHDVHVQRDNRPCNPPCILPVSDYLITFFNQFLLLIICYLPCFLWRTTDQSSDEIRIGITYSITYGITHCIAYGLTYGITFRGSFGIAYGLTYSIPFRGSFGITYGISYGGTYLCSDI